MAEMTPPADLELGAFSDDPPWVVDLDQITWTAHVDTVRDVVRRQVPDRVRPRRIPPFGRLLVTARHLGLGLLLWALLDRRKGPDASRAGISRRLRIAAERLGPTYIKLAQIISSGRGIFPDELVDEMVKCRDQVPAEPFATVRRVVEEDLGQPLEDVFAEFGRTPLAAASIAQVHVARLHSGEEVVVKVQRPTVARLVDEDIRVMASLSPHLVGRIPITALANPPSLVELFAETIAEELDFRLEAENMLDVARTLVELGQRGYVVPRPHPTLVTPRVLVMERLSGYAFDDVAGMTDAGIDTEAVLRTGMIGFMEGALLHGVFHGDLHGGNLFVLPDGRTALLDFGITGRLTEARRLAFLRLLITATMNDLRGQIEAIRDLGALPADVDVDGVIADLALDQPAVDPTSMSGEELADEMQRVMKGLLGIGARFPKELMLFVKNLVFLDGAIATLAPDLDLFAEITHISTYFATTHGERIANELGVPAEEQGRYEVDLSSVKASFGVTEDTSTLTARELRERRNLIRQRLRTRR
jgi:ubiquinone biosynthesis protein